MISLMTVVALVVGLLFGWLVFARSIGLLVTVFVFAFDKSKSRFMALYDLMDDEVSFKFMILKDVKTYADYLRLHKAARKSIYKRFRHHFDAVVKQFLIRSLPLVLIPTILFWSHWYWYLIGVATSILGLIGYEYLIRNHRTGFYQRVMLNTLLSGYLKDDR